MQEFQLRVIPLDNNSFALELYQCAYKRAGEKKRPAAKRIGKLNLRDPSLPKPVMLSMPASKPMAMIPKPSPTAAKPRTSSTKRVG
jgi:hypothetical protein